MKDFEKRVKLIWNSIEFTHGVRRALIMSMALVYFIHLGFDVVWVTTMLAVTSTVSMLMEFPTGAVADYDSRKKSLMISFFLFSVAFFGIFFLNNFWLIAFFWFLAELAWTFSTGAGSAWAIDALNIGKKKLKIVRFISRGYVSEKSGHIIGGLIGIVIIAINFRLIWLVGALTNLIMFFIIWLYVEERNFKPEEVPAGYLKKSFLKAKESYFYIIHKKNRNLKILMVIGFFNIVAVGAFWIGMPLMLVDVLNLKYEYLAGLLSWIALISLIAPFLAERITNERGFRNSMFGLFLLLSFFIVAFSFSSSLIFAIIVLTLFYFILTIMDVVEESVSHNWSDSKIRASLGSIGSINWNVANSIGVFLAGLGIEFFGIANTILISGIMASIVSFGYLFLKD